MKKLGLFLLLSGVLHNVHAGDRGITSVSPLDGLRPGCSLPGNFFAQWTAAQNGNLPAVDQPSTGYTPARYFTSSKKSLFALIAAFVAVEQDSQDDLGKELAGLSVADKQSGRKHSSQPAARYPRSTGRGATNHPVHQPRRATHQHSKKHVHVVSSAKTGKGHQTHRERNRALRQTGKQA